MSQPLTKPIVYEFDVDVRFSDLDFYGHVNLSKYLDMVTTSRFMYLERVLKVPLSETAKLGVAFYTIKVEQEFLRAIVGLQTVRCRSHIEKLEGTRLEVPFEMTDVEGKKVFSKGLLTFAIVEIKTNRPCNLPDAARPWFFS